jgi:membrane-associated phospholipid phosphatase
MLRPGRLMHKAIPIVAAAPDAERYRFIAWPGREIFKITASLSVVFGAVFYGLYGLTDYLTGLHDYRIDIHFGWEQSIPFIPEMAVFYLLISPLLMLAPFVIRSIEQFMVLFRLLLAETAIAALFFLLLPVADAFPPHAVTGLTGFIFNMTDNINLTYNEMPSLHVAFTCTGCLVFGNYLDPVRRLILYVVGGLIILSTVLTHQHHVLGVLSGLVLAWLVHSLINPADFPEIQVLSSSRARIK